MNGVGSCLSRLSLSETFPDLKVSVVIFRLSKEVSGAT